MVLRAEFAIFEREFSTNVRFLRDSGGYVARTSHASRTHECFVAFEPCRDRVTHPSPLCPLSQCFGSSDFFLFRRGKRSLRMVRRSKFRRLSQIRCRRACFRWVVGRWRNKNPSEWLSEGHFFGVSAELGHIP